MRRTFLPALAALAVAAATVPAIAADPADAREANARLGRGINLGNALEAPREGEWGMTLEESYFDEIAKAGFDSVRIPIRWSAHAKAEAPYTVDPEFFRRVDWAVDQALSRGLAAVINVHHYGEMDGDPEAHVDRLVGLWSQIAKRYRDRPQALYFELLNEPHDKLTDELWNQYIPRLLATVRESNPDRFVIIGPGSWNSFRNLPKLELPDDDRRLIATFHYYEPFKFTHQGAEWVAEAKDWKGITWTGTDEELEQLRDAFDAAEAWSKRHDRPLFLGEFGAYSKADMASRAAWTRAVASEAARRGFSTAYWEFGSGFGAYDRDAKAWRGPLRAALVPEGASTTQPNR